MTTTELWALAAAAGEGGTAVEERARFQAEAEAMLQFHSGWALLVTCHRVELYGVGPAPSWPGVLVLHGEAAVRRLVRVAAGLESAVLGENEVLRQVRDALQAAAGRRDSDPRIVRLFETAIAVGRQVRSRKPAPTPGLAERAVAWLDSRASLSSRPVLVAGTGVMGAALARAAREAGAVVTTAGRDRGRAAIDLRTAADLVPRTTAVAVALAGPWAELAGLARLIPPLADLSSPPAVPESVRSALGADFLGIDGLYHRSEEAAEWSRGAEARVEAAVQEYSAWLAGRGSVDALRALQVRAEERRRKRIERLLRRLPDLADRDRELISTMSEQLVSDLLHEPVSALRGDVDGSRAEAARRLFRL